MSHVERLLCRLRDIEREARWTLVYLREGHTLRNARYLAANTLDIR